MKNFFCGMRAYYLPLIFLSTSIASLQTLADNSKIIDCIAQTIGDQIILCSDVKETQENFKIDDYKQALEKTINTQLIEADLKKIGQTVSEKDIDAAIKQYTGGRFDEQSLKTALSAQGMSLQEYRRGIKEQLQKMRIIQYKLKSASTVSEEDIEQEYRQKYGNYQAFDVQMDILLLPLKNNPSALEIAQVKGLALKAKKMLESGKEGAKIVDEMPKTTRASYTHIEKISREDILPEFMDTVFSASPGEIIGPLRSSLGFNVIKVIKHLPVDQIPLEKVKKDLHNELVEKKIENSFRKYVEELRSKA